MRGFEIYVKDKKVDCDLPALHVPPNHIENIAVYLKAGLEDKYKLDDLDIKKNDCLKPQRLNESTIILRDENDHGKSCQVKFGVTLTPRKSGANKPQKLDPIIVNE